ncbi:GntR family transcriptional regulator [Bariatricus massiliensis]|uniref:GntR family transcriptional regulator n=1 Tax=Bariatricus massiliensis TaxID=1745713 RepID=A0ABS8DGK5_9FIRM|nr:GntR family transcriptional regulator [Bariatricus massiliensis]MCB7304427.1 GntR family transcriptional regulator [Bariatricus massiliensis]MCB7375078.1 GntR family transcriptional regulator [Bariatricus massiliensis]MCB7387537.1 GntR family transcriptional regulator [Bariatricus massiliensis]MCB7411699.1 GntR family transcriptional regulator [Bariatricus massiliensis]MCQ5253834.1 GntR family transcriptional regulator [Bariatricus massiliensis]
MMVENLEDVIVRDIKNRIMSGELKEHTKLSERDICDAYSTSRSTVRIVIDRLKKDNWLYVKAKSGTYIAAIDTKEIKDSFQLRQLLEPQLLIWNINNFGEEDILRMKQNCENMEHGCHEVYGYSELDNHRVIKEKSQNQIIEKIMDGMMDNILRITSKTSVTEARRRASIIEWRKIIDCIERKEGDDASKYMVLHLINTADEFWSNYGEKEEGR